MKFRKMVHQFDRALSQIEVVFYGDSRHFIVCDDLYGLF